MFDPQELIDAYQGRAGLLARCILYGLVEPNVEINSNILFTLADTLSEELLEIKEDDMVVLKINRAFKWALRDSVPHEIAIYFYMKILAAFGQDFFDNSDDMSEYVSFYEKYGDIINAARN